jgi:hypothetical protein
MISQWMFFSEAEVLAHHRDHGGIAVGALQEGAGLAAEVFGLVVAGHAGEGLVCPQDTTVEAGDHDGVGALAGDKREPAGLGLAVRQPSV